MGRFSLFKRKGSTHRDTKATAAVENTWSASYQPDPSLSNPSTTYQHHAPSSYPAHLRHLAPKHQSKDANLFAAEELFPNRGSASSNTTNTTNTNSTDTSSHHSFISTAPSSTGPHSDLSQDPSKSNKKLFGDIPVGPISRSSTASFLNRAGRTFSLGSRKQSYAEPSMSQTSYQPSPISTSVTSATITPSTTANHTTSLAALSKASHPNELNTQDEYTGERASLPTPPRISEEDFSLDLGGDFSAMFSQFKRSSVIQPDNHGSKSASRNLPTSTVSAVSSPSTASPSPPSEHTPRNQETLTTSTRLSPIHPPSSSSPSVANSPVSATTTKPKHSFLSSFRTDIMSKVSSDSSSHKENPSPNISRRQSPSPAVSSPTTPISDENIQLLQQANAYVTESTPTPLYTNGFPSNTAKKSLYDDGGDDHLFSHKSPPVRNKAARYQPEPKQNNRVMTPAEFEKFKREKERNILMNVNAGIQNDDSDDDDVNYDDDDSDFDKNKKITNQRRKQEAHNTSYRQQMMKVTGDTPNAIASRLNLSLSESSSTPPLTSPSLPNIHATPPQDGDDSDEDVPLAVIAANGPSTRAMNRLSAMPSMTDVRLSMMPPSMAPRPGSSLGEHSSNGLNTAGNRHSQLPAFARRLPTDPFAGGQQQPPPQQRAGLRESNTYAGGFSMPQQQPQQQQPQVGGLVGVIAHEEKARALRRGVNNPNGVNAKPEPLPFLPTGLLAAHQNESSWNLATPSPTGQETPFYGLPGGSSSQMQLPRAQSMMFTPADQAQMQMTQQMTQFMQMQMQLMQMMNQNAGGQGQAPNAAMGFPQSPMGMSGGTIGAPPFSPYGAMPRPMSQVNLPMPEDPRQSMMFGGPDSLGPRRFDSGMRTMSMVQPSPSWNFGGAGPGPQPSIHVQGQGYTPSIAPSERSNLGPSRYRPVSQAAIPQIHHLQADPSNNRLSTLAGSVASPQPGGSPNLSSGSSPRANNETNQKQELDGAVSDDEEEGWAALKAKKERKRSMWRFKKGSDNKHLSTFL